MEDPHNSLLQTLLCKEEESCLNHQNFNLSSVSAYDFEYIEILIQKEAIFQPNSSLKKETNWRKRPHGDAVKWILDKRDCFGFHFRTAYLSLLYFDRFLSRISIDHEKQWAVRLLSIACLSLAAKMEECEVPSLSEYDVDEYSFDGDVIKRMELFVLNTLEWKMICVTPFTYLSYFITLFCGQFRPKELMNRAVLLISAVMAEINVTDHRPSVVAAAAVLAAYDHHLTKQMLEIKINAVPCWGSMEKEHTLLCYDLLQEIGMLNSKVSPDSVSTPSSSDDSMIRPTLGNKRRLAHINGDQHLHCPRPKTRKTSTIGSL